MTVGVPLGAIVADHASWRAVFAIVAITAALAAVLAAGGGLVIAFAGIDDIVLAGAALLAVAFAIAWPLRSGQPQ